MFPSFLAFLEPLAHVDLPTLVGVVSLVFAALSSCLSLFLQGIRKRRGS